MIEGDLAGKIAVVCGGSTGIGRACALRLAEAGASVAVVARRPEPIDEVVAMIGAAGGEALGIPADLSVSDEVKPAIERVAEHFGGIDVLVNSQGIQRYGTVEETSDELWDEVMNTNTRSMYLTARYVIPAMRMRGGGAIVNVGSVQGLATQTQVAAYSTSKAANISLTRTIAVDYAKEGIRCNIVLPASIDTPMLREAADTFRGEGTIDEMVGLWGKMHPLGRVGTPDDVAHLVVFLAGPKAAFITGAEIKVDGGMMAALGVVLPE